MTLTNGQAVELTKYVRASFGKRLGCKVDEDSVQDVILLVLQQAPSIDAWEDILRLAAMRVKAHTHRWHFSMEEGHGSSVVPQHVRLEDISEVEQMADAEPELPEPVQLALDKLTHAELELLRMVHGLDGYEELTQEEIGARLRINQATVSRRLDAVHAKLAEHARQNGRDSGIVNFPDGTKTPKCFRQASVRASVRTKSKE